MSPAVGQGSGFRRSSATSRILVDYVFAYRGYLSDYVSIFSLGQLPDELAAAHAAMLELQQQIKLMAKPGVPSGSIYDFALEHATRCGYGEHFMGSGAERIRFVGHGVGLELDEFPFLNTGQELELRRHDYRPGAQADFPSQGVVGIENTHVVTPQGLEQLGQYPEEITVV